MEEKIIDGVNVAGCVRLQDDKISCDLGGECKGWENCTYKQLKRLEQENARLKEENVKLLFDKGTLVEFCNKLTQIIDEKKESENKLLQILQEIKAIAERLLDKNEFVYMNYRDVRQIIRLITKAEVE